MKKFIFIVFTFFLLYNYSFADASSVFWEWRIIDIFKGWWNDLITILDNMAWYIIWLFYFISVMIVIYWWFVILTSAWNADRVKKWKNIIIFAVLGLVLVFLASQIVNWPIEVLSRPDIVWDWNK